jgi:mRNA interferase RelE/StbE
VTVRIELVPYQIEYSRTARKKLEKLSSQNLERILEGVERLAEQALGDIEKLGSGYVAPFRLRIGDFRLYFDTRLEPPILFIADIEKRGEAYGKKSRR